MKDYQEEVETWLLGERGVQGLGRKPSSWLPWFPRAQTCMVTIHNPGAGPGRHTCQSPEGEAVEQGQMAMGQGRERLEQKGSRVDGM